MSKYCKDQDVMQIFCYRMHAEIKETPVETFISTIVEEGISRIPYLLELDGDDTLLHFSFDHVGLSKILNTFQKRGVQPDQVYWGALIYEKGAGFRAEFSSQKLVNGTYKVEPRSMVRNMSFIESLNRGFVGR